MMATYRPHNSPLMEWVQTRGRLRSNKAMIDRNNLTGLVHALKIRRSGMVCPDRITAPRAACLRRFSPSRRRHHQRHLCAFPLIGAKMLSISMVRKLDRRATAWPH